MEMGKHSFPLLPFCLLFAFCRLERIANQLSLRISTASGSERGESVKRARYRSRY